MKTKDLIKMLQDVDPSGETEVCVDNLDIYFAERKPAYWDGRLQLLIRDESKKPFYHVAGAKVISSGDKIELHTMGVEDVIENDPDAIVDLTDIEKNMSSTFEEWKKRIENWRAETKRIIAQVRAERKQS